MLIGDWQGSKEVIYSHMPYIAKTFGGTWMAANRRAQSPSCEMKETWDDSKGPEHAKIGRLKANQKKESLCQNILRHKVDESYIFPSLNVTPHAWLKSIALDMLSCHEVQAQECHWLDRYWSSNDWRLLLSKQSFGISVFKRDNWSQTSLLNVSII